MSEARGNGRWRAWATGVVMLMALAGCADDDQGTAQGAAPSPRQVVPALKPTTRPPASAFTWNSPAGTVPGASQTDAGGTPADDPPAAADTPLCGTAARQTNAMGAAIDPEAVGAAGVCATYACYDPLTATYLGADGFRHVCRLAG